jgi:hypothetical protein
MAKKKKKKIRTSNAITITDGTPPTVDKDPVHISKGTEVAHWKTNPPGQDFLVVFEGESPFDDWYFHPGRATSKTTVVPSGTKKYKYTLFTAGGAHKNDPAVIIRP